MREDYLNTLIQYKDIPLIKVITGVRRCGKSTLLSQFRDYLLSINVLESQILYMNFESSLWYEITDYKSLFQYIKNYYKSQKLYILLDEIQNVESWEKCVNSLLVDLDCDVYITGSNAYLLSSELTTLLAGRVLTLKLFPFSFFEYNEINKNKGKEENFKNYLTYGGMPMTLNLQDKNLIVSYLNDIKDVVLKNDVIARNHIKDVAMLDNLLRYIASVIGNLTTSSSITDFLNRSGSKVHNETIDNYLKMLENSYIIYRVPRFQLEGKELLKTQGKYYFVDNGIRNIIHGFQKFDSGSALENVIYMELLRRGYTVSIGKLRDLEIDFVARKADDIRYYQVCQTLNDEKVLEREKKSLLYVQDNYPKIILTMDAYGLGESDGIQIQNIIDFLLEK